MFAIVRSLPSIAFGAVLTGCAQTPSLQWVDQSVQTPPAYFLSRNALPDQSGLYRYKLTELPGRVLTKEKGATAYQFTEVVLKDGYVPALEVIPEADGKVFDAIIDSKIAASATYLALGGSVDGNNVASVYIKDRLISFIKNEDVPWLKLAKVAGPLRPDDQTERYWVQGVLLATLDFRKATAVDVKAGGKLSEAFSANGQIYNKAETAVHDYRISLELVNLRQISFLNMNTAVDNWPDFVEVGRPKSLQVHIK